jgi:hypothetical protein
MMVYVPNSKVSRGRDLSRRFGIAHSHPVAEGPLPSHVAQQGLMNLEAERLLVRLAQSKLQHRAVGHDFIDGDFRRCRVKGFAATEWGDEYVHIFGGNAVQAPGKNAEIV